MATSATVPFINEKLGLLSISKEVTQGIPNWSFTANGGSTTTLTTDTTDGLTHDNAISGAADDFFNGAQIYIVSASNLVVGTVLDVTDFAVAAGTATFTFATALAGAASDTFYVYWPQPASNISINFGYENLERDIVRQTLDKPASLKGLKTADGSFDVEIPGMITPSADTTAPAIDRHSAICSVLGTRTATVGTKVVTGTLGASLFTVALVTPFTVGQYVIVNNQVRKITVVNDTTIDEMTVDPPLSAAPAADDIVYSGEQWVPDDTGHQTLTILHLKDDRLTEIRGAACSLKTTNEFGAFSKFTVDFNAAYIDSSQAQNGWDLQDGFTAMDGSQTSAKPPVYKSCAVGHFGTVDLVPASWEADFGHERSEHRYACSHHFTITARNATMAVNYKDSLKDTKESYEANGTQSELIMAVGNTAGDCIAVGGNAQLQDASSANNNEFQDWNSNFAFVDDQTSASTPKKPKLVRF